MAFETALLTYLLASHGKKRLVLTSRDIPTSRSPSRLGDRASRSRLGKIFERLGLEA